MHAIQIGNTLHVSWFIFILFPASDTFCNRNVSQEPLARAHNKRSSALIKFTLRGYRRRKKRIKNGFARCRTRLGPVKRVRVAMTCKNTKRDCHTQWTHNGWYLCAYASTRNGPLSHIHIGSIGREWVLWSVETYRTIFMSNSTIYIKWPIPFQRVDHRWWQAATAIHTFLTYFLSNHLFLVCNVYVVHVNGTVISYALLK